MHISFHGANRGVTGSCHLLACGNLRILIDCGLYQGDRDNEAENEKSFGFNPADIDVVVLTHAHLDHCGRLPLLYKRGFRGEVITTSATRALARLVLLDSAHLQEEEAKYQQRKAERRGLQSKLKPLYSIIDTLNCFDLFKRTVGYRQPIRLDENVQITLHDAGHILGSASVLFELKDQGQHRRVLFSGDIGSSDHPLLGSPVPPSDCDVVVMETTYGDRLHKPLAPSIDELYHAINDTFERGGNVIIPTFALERAQELLYFLREGLQQHKIPRSTHVFLDSPMAISATEVFRQHADVFAPKTTALFEQGIDPFELKGLHFVRETAESMALNRIKSGAIIMAGSGMCTGGRVRHHLKQNLGRPESSIVFVGYAAVGTLARQIIDGAQHVHIFGDEFPVNASIHTINGFSAHADQQELLAWHQQTGTPDHTFLVHGEERVMHEFAKHLTSPHVHLPELHTRVEI